MTKCLRALNISQHWPARSVVLNAKWAFSHDVFPGIHHTLTHLTGQISITTEFCSQMCRSSQPVLTNGNPLSKETESKPGYEFESKLFPIREEMTIMRSKFEFSLPPFD